MPLQSKAKILIIDDMKTIVESYKTILGEEDFDISVAYSGKEAMDIIKGSNRFDLVISDIVMPIESDELRIADSGETGYRLLENAIEYKMCSSFYFITVRKDLKPDVERLCRENNIEVKFESRLEHKPEKFKSNVEAMLLMNRSYYQSLDKNDFNKCLKNLTIQLSGIEESGRMIALLEGENLFDEDFQQANASLYSILYLINDICNQGGIEFALKDDDLKCKFITILSRIYTVIGCFFEKNSQFQGSQSSITVLEEIISSIKSILENVLNSE